MVSELSIRITGKIDDLKKKLKEAEKEVDNFSDEAGNSVSSINGALSGVAAGIAATFSVAALTGFAREVFNVTSEFQKLGAVLTNTLGSSALAQLRMDELQEFASVTPFGVTELTNAFVKLANQGFKPTIDQIRQLGDLASSTGKSFDQLTEAIIDAQVGEYERLKEFGIRAKDAGDQVIFTFKGVSTEVEKTSSAIREYITGLGDAEGVTGAMAAISETLAGQVSNLQDNYDQMLLAIGDRTGGAFSTAISWVDSLINKIKDLNTVAGIAEKFGIEGDFWQSVGRFVGIGPDFTDRELAVGAILNARDETAKYIQTVISGAKSTDDFQKGIDELWRRMADKRASGDAQSTINGVVDALQNGVNALLDAQRQFNEEANKAPDANFGKPKSGKTGKSDAEKLSDKLAEALIKNDNRVQVAIRQGRDKELEQARIKYEELYKMAKNNSEAIIQITRQEADEVDAINRKYDSQEENARVEGESRVQARRRKLIENGLKITGKLREEDRKAREKAEKDLAKRIYDTQLYYSTQLGNAVGNALEDALGRGENFFKALRDEFKRTLIRMAADAAAAQIGKAIMNGINKSGSSSGGGFWNFLSGAIGWASKLFGGSSGYSSGSFSTGNYGGGNFPTTNPVKGGGFVPGVQASAPTGSSKSVSTLRGTDIYMANVRTIRLNERFNGGQ